MKRLFYFLSALVLFNSCQQFAELEELVQSEKTDAPKCIHATSGSKADKGNASRTVVYNDRDILWQNGDMISFYMGEHNNMQYIYRGKVESSTAEFEFVHDLLGTQPAVHYTQAIYPYDGYTKCVADEENDANRLTVYYPAEQNYVKNSFGKNANLMVATGKDDTDVEMYFQNACGYLIIKLYGNGTKVKSITVTPQSEKVKIAGEATIISKYNAEPQISMTDNATSSVTLHCGEEGVALAWNAAEAEEFWFALPPVTFEGGLKVDIEDISGAHYVRETTSTIEIERNMIQPMEAIQLKHYPEEQIIMYTRKDGGTEPVTFGNEAGKAPFDAKIAEHRYDQSMGKFVILFETPVTVINENTFSGTDTGTDITTIALPNSLKTIADKAFYRCGSLQSITIPAHVERVGTKAFAACGLKTAHVGAKRLDKLAFVGCSSMETLTITSDVEYIDQGAFSGLKNLTTLNIGESEKPLVICGDKELLYEFGPFYSSPLTSITLMRDIDYRNYKGEPFNPVGWEEGVFAYKDFNYYKRTVTVVLGDKVTTILDKMFTKLSVQSITLPAGIKSIGNNAFDDCEELTSINIPAGVQRIGHEAFNHCDALTSISIPASVTTIGYSAFRQCKSLNTLRIEDSDTPLKLYYSYNLGIDEWGPFYYTALKEVYLGRDIIQLDGKGNPSEADGWEEGVFSNFKYDDENWFTKINIGPKVTKITDYMFSHTRITSMYIYPAIKSIGKYAFLNCTQFGGLSCNHTTPPTLGENAFEDCDNFWYIKVPAEAIPAFKSAYGWSAYDKNNAYGKNFYYEME